MVENLQSNNHTWITDDKLVTISSFPVSRNAKSPATEIKFLLLLLLTNLF